MSAEYSVRKNAFTADGGTHKVARILDVADGLRRFGEFESAEMLTAYAERIKADEGAVTDEVIRRAAIAYHTSDAMMRGWQPDSRDLRRMREALLAIWPKTPAQAAQVDSTNWFAGKYPAAAEPVAQGEADAVDVDAERAAYEQWFDGEQGKPYDGCWVFGRAAWLARAALAAQPRAVPSALGDDELAEFAKTIAEFNDCEITETPQHVLMRWAELGLLVCEQFELTKKGQDLLAAAPSPGESE